MIRSMTGFGASDAQSEVMRATVTVRSLNHRYLDLTVHAPRHLQALEPDVKRLVQARIARGRVEVSLQATLADEQGTVLLGSRPFLDSLIGALRRVQSEYGLAGDLRVGDLARFPGVLEVAERAGGVDEARRAELLALVGRALDGLGEMRRAEGQHLETTLRQLLDGIEAAAGRIARAAEEEKGARRDALWERMKELRQQLGLEEGRLYQEVVRAVERQDVAEEVQRLQSHVDQCREALGGAEPSGKRLDFLAQEMAREANTIGGKSASTALSREVVALKGEVEKLREQVQNVE